MIELAHIALLLAGLANVHQAANNFSVDLTGDPDTRVATWGYAGVQTWRVQFHPPAGYRVRVLRVFGDLVAWPRVMPGDAAVAEGKYAGVLLGLQTTAPDESEDCTPCASNTFLYRQLAIDARPGNMPFDVEVSAGGLLGADNVAVVKVANWLDTAGTIHVEPTINWVFTWEPERAVSLSGHRY